MGIPFAPFLALGGVVALFFGRVAPPRLLWPFNRRLKREAPLADTSNEGSVPETPEYQPLRVSPPEGFAPSRPSEPAQLPSFGVNASASSSPTSSRRPGCSPPDRLAQARSRAPRRAARSRRRSSTKGSRPAPASRRLLASRHHLPFVELGFHRRRRARRRSFCRCTSSSAPPALPYALRDDGSTWRSRIPRTSTWIDELRLATRHADRVRRRPARGDRRATCEAGLRESADRSACVRARTRPSSSSRTTRRKTRRISTSTTASRRRRSCGSRTRSSSRPPRTGASDIHFEPQEDGLVVRFRVDGVLHEVQRIPKRMINGITTRLKVIAKLDIAERRKPQDGRMTLNAAAAGRMLDVRVATLPDGRRRVGRDAASRQVEARADAQGARPVRRDARAALGDHRPAYGSAPGHRADRLR